MDYWAYINIFALYQYEPTPSLMLCYNKAMKKAKVKMLIQSNDKCLTMHQDNIINHQLTNWSLIYKLKQINHLHRPPVLSVCLACTVPTC